MRKTHLTSLFLVSALFTVTAFEAAAGLPNTRVCQDWYRMMIEDGKNDGIAKTDQLVVMDRHGKVLFNWSDGDFKTQTPHQLWSISKSVTATIAGAAVQEGKIKLSDRVASYISSRGAKNPKMMSEMKIEDLISMTSGLNWSEHNDDRAEESSDLPFMYTYGYHDLTAYALKQGFSTRPGTVFNYSSANGDILMAVLKKAYGKAYERMPWNSLFTPLGLSSAHFEQDGSGTYVGSAYVYLSALDLAKFGLLYMNDGKVGQRRILPEGWVAWSRELVPTSTRDIKKREDFKRDSPYSRGGFWLNTPVKGLGRPLPSVPEDAYYGSGLFGQIIIVVPSRGLIIARTAHDDQATEITDKMTGGALRCFGGRK